MMKDNIDRLLEALDSPERLSDATFNDLLGNAEIRDLYTVLCRTAAAVKEYSEPDIDVEWADFLTKHEAPKKSSALPFFIDSSRRKAAAILGGIAVSLIAVAATIAIKTDTSRIESDTCMTVDSVESTVIATMPTSEIVTFRKQALDSILSAVAGYHGAAVDFRDARKKELFLYYKWDMSLSLEETVAQLNNFEQINLKLSGKVIIVE